MRSESYFVSQRWRAEPDSNRRPLPPQGSALSTELPAPESTFDLSQTADLSQQPTVRVPTPVPETTPVPQTKSFWDTPHLSIAFHPEPDDRPDVAPSRAVAAASQNHPIDITGNVVSLTEYAISRPAPSAPLTLAVDRTQGGAGHRPVLGGILRPASRKAPPFYERRRRLHAWRGAVTPASLAISVLWGAAIAAYVLVALYALRVWVPVR